MNAVVNISMSIMSVHAMSIMIMDVLVITNMCIMAVPAGMIMATIMRRLRSFRACWGRLCCLQQA